MSAFDRTSTGELDLGSPSLVPFGGCRRIAREARAPIKLLFILELSDYHDWSHSVRGCDGIDPGAADSRGGLFEGMAKRPRAREFVRFSLPARLVAVIDLFHDQCVISAVHVTEYDVGEFVQQY